jgi:G3E family GTPase
MVARHPEAMVQLVRADRIVLTKLDLRDVWQGLEDDRLRDINPFADIVAGEAIVDDSARLVAAAPIGQPLSVLRPAQHSQGVVAHGFELRQPVTRAGLAAFASVAGYRLGDALLRCKGIVHIAGRAVLVQGVGARFTFEDAPESAASAAAGLTCIVQNVERHTVAALLTWLHVPEGTQPPAPESV